MKTSLPLLLSFAFALLLATCVHAGSAGVVVSSSGSASIVSAQGKTRSAKAGDKIEPGDKLVTGDESRLNVKFSDNSQVQLHVRSQFRIDQYQFASKNDENAKGFFSLLKGGFRTVTGLLGKYNRDAYRVTTSSATIGIRGTEYSARLDNGLHVQVDRGEISLANLAGTFSVSEGQRAYVADRQSAPRHLNLRTASQAAAAVGRSGTKGGATDIQGGTTINATAKDINGIAVGQDNAASNKVGAIGGK